MLTSFFRKSKPFNFLVVSVYLLSGYLFCLFYVENIVYSTASILKISFSFFTYVFFLFLLNFIIRKNKLTKNNSFSILFFSAFMLMFPSIFTEIEIVLSNVFLFLALRRIVSLPSEINTEKKILDASIWISVAVLFNFWSILFFAVLFVAVFQRASKNYKYIFIPFVGFASVFILATVYNLLVNASFLWFLELNISKDFIFYGYLESQLLIPLLFIILLLIISTIHKIANNTNIPLKEKSKYVLLFYTLIIGVLLVLISPNKNGSELIFLFAPLSIFATNYIESLRKFWISEVTLWITILLPLLLCFL